MRQLCHEPKLWYNPAWLRRAGFVEPTIMPGPLAEACVNESSFWRKLDELVAKCALIIDRPRGLSHPRYRFAYPLDYGYLEGTRSADGDGIDVWLGSLPDRTVTGVICTVDLTKRDAELKILLGCTPEEAKTVLSIHNTGAQAGILVERPAQDISLSTGTPERQVNP